MQWKRTSMTLSDNSGFRLSLLYRYSYNEIIFETAS